MSYMPWTKVCAEIAGGDGAAPVEWADVQNKPASFTPATHGHDYQATGSYSLTSHNHSGVYQPVGSYLISADLTWAALAGKPSTFAPSAHSHPIADVPGLQTALDGKQASGSYAPSSHNHDAVYAAAGHNHSGVYEPVIASGQASQFWRGDKTWAAPAGASPYWNEITLANDYTQATNAFVTITGMTFTPTANTPFEVQAALLIQTTTATNLPRIGVSIGAGQVHGAVQIDQTGATDTARIVQDGTFLALAVNVQVPAGGLATANSPRLCYVTIRGKAGASPGAISLQMACESAAANVCFVKAGSQMRYKLT